MLYGVPLSLLVSGFIFPIGVLIYWVTNNAWTFGQQYFILRKMPPPGSPAALARAAADKPAIDSRTLAPKPGAKPVRTKPAPSATPQASANGAAGSSAVSPAANRAGNPAGGAPPNKGKRKRR
jgi:YidC/Oxa1 family membrane protein insertase